MPQSGLLQLHLSLPQGLFIPWCIWSDNSVCPVYRAELGTAQDAVLWPELLSGLSSLPGTPTTAQKNPREMGVNPCESLRQCRLEPGTAVHRNNRKILKSRLHFLGLTFLIILYLFSWKFIYGVLMAFTTMCTVCPLVISYSAVNNSLC